jgi:8-oxo-dGTP diphosphatase
MIDQEHILLCKTVDLGVNFYFLPGGHVKHNESVKTSLLRELREETGVECKINKFLGCLEYGFEPDHSSICHNHEYNFIFEAESEALKFNCTIPRLEAHIELVWVPIEKLSEIDFRAEPLRDLIVKWLKLEADTLFKSVMQ